MAHKKEHTSLCGLFLILLGIAAGVAALVYALSMRRQHLHDEKWKDYDECGLA